LRLPGGFLKFAGFVGRASRREFAVAFAASLGIAVLGTILSLILRQSPAMTLIQVVLDAIEVWIFIAAAARRQHDLGKSAWQILLWLVPIVGVVFLAWWFARPGAPGTNRYGPQPSA